MAVVDEKKDKKSKLGLTQEKITKKTKKVKKDKSKKKKKDKTKKRKRDALAKEDTTPPTTPKESSGEKKQKVDLPVTVNVVKDPVNSEPAVEAEMTPDAFRKKHEMVCCLTDQ